MLIVIPAMALASSPLDGRFCALVRDEAALVDVIGSESAVASGRFRITSDARLSARNPRKAGWRSVSSCVHSVSTSIPDVRKLYGPAVRFGDTTDEFLDACEQALAESESQQEERRTLMRNITARTSWDKTVAQMQTLIDAAARAGLTEAARAMLEAPPIPKPRESHVPLPICAARFGYPLRGGFQALMNGFLPLFQGELELNAEVTRVSPLQQTVTLADGRRYRYDTLISTLPLPQFIAAMGEEAPLEIRHAARQLRHVSIRRDRREAPPASAVRPPESARHSGDGRPRCQDSCRF